VIQQQTFWDVSFSNILVFGRLGWEMDYSRRRAMRELENRLALIVRLLVFLGHEGQCSDGMQGFHGTGYVYYNK
jgi:hypothetical protein